MKKIYEIFRKIVLCFSDAIAPSKISSATVEGKKGSSSKILQLIKYEKEKIPLPRITIDASVHKKEKESQEGVAYEESVYQHYYLYQFINIERQSQIRKKRESTQKRLAQVMSFMHLLSISNPGSKMRCGPAMNIRIYNPTIQSVTFNKDPSPLQQITGR
ncbi:hypothetical protein NHE_0666 [Neorickettsia helminthoeca str. Oregon]|uniref:Uncharacterized protein n=1 Tax=Neorickettsia helminthoeca str. Oregon TaxID=1286528 RepID=X5HKL9_9RICK|nr:hypothetical protein [Neorickettsia helminthoeca]AHX11599.1 hypothetical protein NHE_0666 [Neorickettsia helminthoeca str. Oregon]